MPEAIGIDHLYIAVTDMEQSEHFYNLVLRDTLGFRKNTFTLNGTDHIQYYNRHFGYVIRPAETSCETKAIIPGLHHFCLRVETVDEVHDVERILQNLGIDASATANYPQYATDYWATFFTDPDGTRLEVTNFRAERRQRNERWDST